MLFKSKIMIWFWRIFLFLIFAGFGYLKFYDFTFFDNAMQVIYYHLTLDKFLTFHSFMMLWGSVEIFIGIVLLLKFKTWSHIFMGIIALYMILNTIPVVFDFSDKSVLFYKNFEAFWEKFVYIFEIVLTSVWGIFLLGSGK